MTKYRWIENTKPDRPGIWLRKMPGCLIHTVNVYASNLAGYEVGTYCFVMDWPAVADPEPRYRDVTSRDIGRYVEFSDHGCPGQEWNKGPLLAIHAPDVRRRYVSRFYPWKYARIIDDGKPAKQAREVTLYDNKLENLGLVPLDLSSKPIKFREVID